MHNTGDTLPIISCLKAESKTLFKSLSIKFLLRFVQNCQARRDGYEFSCVVGAFQLIVKKPVLLQRSVLNQSPSRSDDDFSDPLMSCTMRDIGPMRNAFVIGNLDKAQNVARAGAEVLATFILTSTLIKNETWS